MTELGPAAPGSPDDVRTALALDAGQSGIRTMVRRGASWLPGPELAGIVAGHPLLDQLVRVVRQVHDESGPVELVTGGVSGLSDDDDPEVLRKLLAPVGVREVVLAHDSVTSYLGALGPRPGAVVAAGTGVVVLAVGESARARVDGWGHLLGDVGGGYWIGRAALEAVLRAHDGRGPETALSRQVMTDYPDIEGMYLELQGDPHRVRRIASYARLVADLADSDPVSARIVDAAASELALSVAVALERVSETLVPVVAATGGVFSGRRLRERFGDLLRGRLPGARVVEPLGTSLDGAVRLADPMPLGGLRAAVRRARQEDG